VREEAICYRLPVEDFLDLTANNPEFAGFYFRDISHKLDALARQDVGPSTVGALTARVGGALLADPAYVSPEPDLHEAAVRMDAEGSRALLLKDGDGRLGIVTGVDLTRAAVRDRRPLETPVREVAHFEPGRRRRGQLPVRGGAADGAPEHPPPRRAPGRARSWACSTPPTSSPRWPTSPTRSGR
jgi:CBS domain-containing protein